MDVKEKAAKLKAELERRAQEGTRGRFSEAMKAEVLEYWRQSKQGGATQEMVARELGLSPWTLSRWSVKARRAKGRPVQRGQQEAAEAPGFHAVKVKPVSQEPGRSVVLHGPSGVRVEGLSVSEVVRVLKELGG
jgi:transposase-like protein